MVDVYLLLGFRQGFSRDPALCSERTLAEGKNILALSQVILLLCVSACL